MKRYNDDKLLIKRRYLEFSPNDENILGYFRKRKPKGCTKSRCYICHREKLLKIKTKKDLINDAKAKDSLADYFEEAG